MWLGLMMLFLQKLFIATMKVEDGCLMIGNPRELRLLRQPRDYHRKGHFENRCGTYLYVNYICIFVCYTYVCAWFIHLYIHVVWLQIFSMFCI